MHVPKLNIPNNGHPSRHYPTCSAKPEPEALGRAIRLLESTHHVIAQKQLNSEQDLGVTHNVRIEACDYKGDS